MTLISPYSFIDTNYGYEVPGMILLHSHLSAYTNSELTQKAPKVVTSIGNIIGTTVME
jgi:hypothetical protein